MRDIGRSYHFSQPPPNPRNRPLLDTDAHVPLYSYNCGTLSNHRGLVSRAVEMADDNGYQRQKMRIWHSQEPSPQGKTHLGHSVSVND